MCDRRWLVVVVVVVEKAGLATGYSGDVPIHFVDGCFLVGQQPQRLGREDG